MPKPVAGAAISVALFACGAILCVPLIPHWKLFTFRRQVAAIRLGMNKDAVHAILGKPTYVNASVNEATVVGLRQRGWNGDAKQLTTSMWIRVWDGQNRFILLVFDGDTVLDKLHID